MLIKKADGQLVKQELSLPDLVLDAPDTDALLQNASVVAARMLAGMQRASRSSEYVPDAKETKALKDIVDLTLQIETYRQKAAQNDALALLSDEEITVKLQALATRKLK